MNAINWTAQAWDSVTDDTIHRCWQRTGILPDDEMREGESELENELEAEENEIQSLIHQMNVDDIVASNYINIDTRIEVTDMIDEGDIIAAVQEAPEEEDREEEGEECNTVSNIFALNSIQIIFNYLQQNPDIKVNVSVISGLKDLEHQIGRKQNASLKQLTLENFVKK